MIGALRPEELAERLRRSPGSLLLLDVREADERAIASIEPSLFIPMGEIEARMAEIPRDRPIVVFCHSGARSMMVGAFLSQNGYTDVSNLSGGIDAWSRLVDPAVPRY